MKKRIITFLLLILCSGCAHTTTTQVTQLSEPPIEPRVDKIWHLIPGYNGIKGNAEIPPKIQLQNYRTEPIFKGNPNKPMVALLINVAWGEAYLPRMLEILSKYHVKATFFLDGTWLSKHKKEATEILQAGHQLSNHGYSHKNMSQLTPSQIRQEIGQTQALLQTLGVKNAYFAPPSGDFSKQSLIVADEQKLFTILWTVDTIDWREKNDQAILNRVIPRIEAGSMILMHPTASATAALERLIQAIQARNLKFGTVESLLSTARVKVE